MTTEQYEKIIADVEKEFSVFLAKAESASAEPLTKFEESSEDKSDEKKDEKKEDKKDDEKKDESSSDEKKDEDKKDEPKAEDKKDEDHGYDDQDVEEMHKMYHSMSKAELDLHKATAEKCLMAKCGEMKQMDKSEKETVVKIPALETKVEVKSEDNTLIKSQLETLSKENVELKKNVESLVDAMTKFVNTKKAPARKAITEIGFLNKSEEEKTEEKALSKGEITTILSRKAQEPTLSKSDREAIDKYYLGNAGQEIVRHLLK